MDAWFAAGSATRLRGDYASGQARRRLRRVSAEASDNKGCPPEKPQGSLILGGPSVWLQNRDCA